MCQPGLIGPCENCDGAGLPRCVVCRKPFDHGCNTAACSLECEEAAWNSPDRALYYPDAEQGA